MFQRHKMREMIMFVLQQKAKEERTARFQDLQLTHRQICDMVAIYLGLEPNDVLEGVADDPDHLTLLNALVYGNSRKAVMFYYQDGPHYPVGKKPYCFQRTRFGI